MALTNASEIHWASSAVGPKILTWQSAACSRTPAECRTPQPGPTCNLAPGGLADWRLARALLQTICPVCASGQMTKRTNGTKYFASALVLAIGNVAKVLHSHAGTHEPCRLAHRHRRQQRRQKGYAQCMH